MKEKKIFNKKKNLKKKQREEIKIIKIIINERKKMYSIDLKRTETSYRDENNTAILHESTLSKQNVS